MKLSKNKYLKINSLIKKFDFNQFELITNYGLFSGNTNLFKTLKIYELLNEVSHIKGDIIELGIHKGNTSLLIKKILDIFKIKKKLFLLDHFKGLVNFTNNDTKISKKFEFKYKSNKKQVETFINFFNLKNIKIINKDATTLRKGFFDKKQKFCFVYLDMDLYEPTINALNSIDKHVSKGGYIIFDEGLKKDWSEGKAIKKFYNLNKKKYKMIKINKFYQPDLMLRKL
tara:strand:- start:529 stop:1212 length:684 start_codon:yes stop_codon:yes gene_type:complete